MSVEEWDGVPRVCLTHGQLLYLYSYVPQWQGMAVGPPIPFGHGARAGVRINAIFRATREEAMAAMADNIREACEAEHAEYDEEQWDVTHLVLVNGC